MGTLKEWHADNAISHQETDVPKIGAELYLGFGPLTRGDTGKKTNNGKPIKDTIFAPIRDDPEKRKRTAIDDKVKTTLRLMFPSDYEAELCATLQLIAWFGTVGSRSRNGWGALQIDHNHLKSLTRSDLERLCVTRQLSECLGEEWPHAVGKDDNGPLVWKTKVTGDWRAIMKELARIKIAFRTQPRLSLNGVLQGQFAPRHLLAYPVTHHLVNGTGWGGQGRLANQIRFKLAKTNNGQLEGVIVHLPCALPSEMAAAVGGKAAHGEQIKTWQDVHTILDQQATRLK